MGKSEEVINNFINYGYKGVYKRTFEYKTKKDITVFARKIKNLLKDEKMIVHIILKQIK